MVARPPFTIKFNKGGDMTLAIQCEFPIQEEFQPPAEGEEFSKWLTGLEITLS